MNHQEKKVWVWLVNAWVYDQLWRGSKVQDRIIPFTTFHRFCCSFPLLSVSSSVIWEHGNAYVSFRFQFLPENSTDNLSDLQAQFYPPGTFTIPIPRSFSSPPLWPGFQVDRMADGVWSPFSLAVTGPPAFQRRQVRRAQGKEKPLLPCVGTHTVAQVLCRFSNVHWNGDRMQAEERWPRQWFSPKVTASLHLTMQTGHRLCLSALLPFSREFRCGSYWIKRG